MIDLEFIKNKLYPENEEERKIGTTDIIPGEIIGILRKGKPLLVSQCFKPITVQGDKFTVKTKCIECERSVLTQFTKTKLMEYLHPKKHELVSKKIYCTECLAIKTENDLKNKIEQEKQKESYEQKLHTQICDNTDKFIEYYLDPNMSWREGTSAQHKTATIINRSYQIYDRHIKFHISGLDYKDFLNTPYWNAISLYAKHLAKFKCQLCSSKENLRTHHKTYENHGLEHLPKVIKEDLIVLCDECHERFHEKNII